MKAAVKVKSYLTTTPIHSNPHTQQDQQKIRLQFSNHKKYSFSPISQSQNCLKNYFNALPEQKRRHNVSVFNFFVKKSSKKVKQIHCPKSKQAKSNSEQSLQISQRFFQPYPSLSTQKLKITHIDSKKNLQIKTQHMIKIPNDLIRCKNDEDQIVNKINENLCKQAKFDRKKYMYYRYRKKPIQSKSDLSIDEKTEEAPTFEDNKKIKRIHSFLNSKIEQFQKKHSQECQPSENAIPLKRSFYRLIPEKNKSFSQIKCQLTIEPIRRDSSHNIMDRQALAKTTRQKQRMKMLKTSGTKIFSQAIHFKSRKCKTPIKDQSQSNPESKESQNDKILGWNFAEQQQQEQQYF